MAEDKDKLDKLNEAADIVEKQKLGPGETMKLLDEMAGKPDFSKLTEEKLNCACNVPRPISFFPIVNTGVTKAVNNVCPDCAKDVSSFAHLCCVTCKMVVGHMPPHKVPSTGFEFVGGNYYHISQCAYCTNSHEKGKADVIEHVLHCRKNNIPTKSDPEFDNKD